jgi:hypothetical protein
MRCEMRSATQPVPARSSTTSTCQSPSLFLPAAAGEADRVLENRTLVGERKPDVEVDRALGDVIRSRPVADPQPLDSERARVHRPLLVGDVLRGMRIPSAGFA